MAALLLVCLLWTAPALAAVGQQAAASGASGAPDSSLSVARVVGAQQFVQQFANNSVATLVLTPAAGQAYGDVRLDLNAWPLPPGQPCNITRNVTVTSDPAYAIIDWGFVQSKCTLAPGVQLTLLRILTTNGRYGVGFHFDVLLRSDGATLVLLESVRRTACLSGGVDVASVEALPRPPEVPGQQLVALVPSMCVRGTCYTNDTLRFVDLALYASVSVDLPQYGGGYVVHFVNTTRVCGQQASSECVRAHGPEACIQQLLREDFQQQGRPIPDAQPVASQPIVGAVPTGGSTASGVPVAAVVVPAVVGTVLLVGAAAAVALCIRRHRRRRGAGSSTHEQRSSKRSGADDVWQRGWALPSESDGWVLIAQRTVPGWSGDAVQDMSLGVLLGSGSYGKVYRGRCMEQEVAVKVVVHSWVTAQRVARECELIMGLQHPNIVRSFQFLTWYKPVPGADKGSASQSGSYATTLPDASDVVTTATTSPALSSREVAGACMGDASSPGSSPLEQLLDAQTWIVTEFCDAGNLYDAAWRGTLTHVDGRVTLLPLLCRLLEVASGMCHLHAHHILHGDLKGSNVLLASRPTAPFGVKAKLSDFGMSRTLAEGHTHRSTRTMGTVTHISPEQLRSGKMSMASDVYAFGIMAWELLTGHAAFGGMHYGQIVERVVLRRERPPMPSNAPQEYAALLQACWADDPVQRPSFEVVKQCLLSMVRLHMDAAQGSGDKALANAGAAALAATAAEAQASASRSGFSGGGAGLCSSTGGAGEGSSGNLVPLNVYMDLRMSVEHAGSSSTAAASSSWALAPHTPVVSKSAEPHDLE